MTREIVRHIFWPKVGEKGELDLVSVATVFVSSEQPRFPIDNVFDGQRGPGGSCWIAADAGEQTVTLAFAIPQAVREVNVESEEHARARTQEMELSISDDGGKTYQGLTQREFRFTPYGATFERESWDISADAVTHLRLRIAPNGTDGGTHTDQTGHASLTSFVVRSSRTVSGPNSNERRR